jgi:hypothetical protein
MAVWYILGTFGIFNCYLAYFIVIWYIFSCFGMEFQEKSGSPAWEREKKVFFGGLLKKFSSG